MPKYKLTYGNARGRCEYIRLILAQSGADWEDHRIEFKDWPNHKSVPPFNMMPYLTVDGDKAYGESLAISRYLATEFNLRGKNNLEALQADMIVDQTSEVLGKLLMMHFTKDEEKKKELHEELVKRVAVFYDQLAKLLGNKKFFLGDDVCYADLMFYAFGEYANQVFPDAMDAQATVKALFERVGALPKVAAYLEKRPKTD